MKLDPEELEKYTDHIIGRGAIYAELAYHSVRGFNLLLLNGTPLSVSLNLSEGVRSRVIVNGSLGFSATNSIRSEDIKAIVEKAFKTAKSTSNIIKKPISMSEERLGRTSYEVKTNKNPENYSSEDLINQIIELYKSIDFNRYKIEIKSVLINFSYTIEEKSIINSDGGLVKSKIPRVQMSYSMTASYADKRANRWHEVAGSGGIELIETLNFKEKIEDDLKSLEIYLVKARPSPKGRMDVVIGPEVVGLAMHEAIGHPSEADRVLGREAAQAGLSYRRRLKTGERIGSSIVTVIDDPTIPGSYGFYLYDDETVPARPRYLILNGILNEYLHNRETAAVMNTNSNASARAKEWWSEPIIRMANTYMAPGDHELDELIEGIDEGIYIKKYMEWNIDDYRWISRYVGFEAYMIKNGRIMEPVRNPALEVNTKELFSSIDAIGKDLEFYAGLCGKGEPGQAVPVWMGGPSIRLRGVNIR